MKTQKSYLKNSKSIEKIKTKIGNTDISAKLEHLNTKLLDLVELKTGIETSLQLTEKEISSLQLEKIKIEGRGLTSEVINKLAYMNLKWERSRQIDIEDIYKD